MSQLRAMWYPGGTVLAIVLLCVRPALGECILTREPSYQLKSDTVDWRMQISSGQSCVRGLRHGRVTIDSAKWPAPGSEDTKLGVFMGPEVSHGEAKIYARVQA